MMLRTLCRAAATALGLVAAALPAATVYTGDRVDGVPVISALDISDLAPGKTHRLMFQGVEMGSGQHWHVPVMVAKGARSGKRVLLVAGVHGDELNPIGVVQQVFADLDATKLSGSVIGIIGPSRPGVDHVTRMWPTTNLGVNLINPNRTWAPPGPEVADSNSVVRHSWLVMNRLIKGNADVGVDLHTGGNGIDFALFAFANYKDTEAQQLARLFPIDQILLEPGFDGTLEYALVRAGIPAITLELGGPRGFHPAMIKAGVTGVRNILSHYKMIDAAIGETTANRALFTGNKLDDIFATASGFTEVRVKLNESVKAGQLVAVQRNSFGDIIKTYTAGSDGRVAIIGTDAIRERGVDVVSILTNTPECAKGCPYNGDEP
jgi:predicted deacylase